MRIMFQAIVIITLNDYQIKKLEVWLVSIKGCNLSAFFISSQYLTRTWHTLYRRSVYGWWLSFII